MARRPWELASVALGTEQIPGWEVSHLLFALAVGVPLVSGLCAKGYRLLNLFCCVAGSPVTRLALNLVCSRGYPGLPQVLSPPCHIPSLTLVSPWERSLAMYPRLAWNS